MQERKKYNYYAFISYKREDEKWAAWLHKQLETYRIPSLIRRNNLNVPEKIYPVFYDKTDITGGKLLERLHSELDESQFLIVICSPNSAKSEWVNREVEHFIESGRTDYIIPFIVEGKPHAENAEQECYPPALRVEAQSELLGISVPELGRHKAFLRTVATLLNLRFDQLVMRDKKRTRRRRILLGTAAGLFLAAAVSAGWYLMPHSAYYNGYVYKNEVPVGLNRLSSAERKSQSDFYRIVTQRGKVVRLEWTNSAGKPAIPVITSGLDEPVRIDFYYEGDQVSRVEYRDETGQTVLTKDYSSNLKSVDFVRSEDGSQSVTLAANQTTTSSSMYSYEDQSQKSEITRYVNTYDEEGYLIKSMFMRDNLNTPTRDNSGVWGWGYERDEEGRITKLLFLDEEGNVHNSKFGVAGWIYEYDEDGNRTAGRAFDEEGNFVRGENGFCQMEATYEDGNAVRIQYLDEKGVSCLATDGIAETRYEYDENGFLTVISVYDAAGNPAYEKEFGCHMMRQTYNREGQIESILYCGENGEPMNTVKGYAETRSSYDSEGRVRQVELYDQEGRKTCDTDTGAYAVSYCYDDEDRLIKETYLDEQGNPEVTKAVLASREWEYDAYGRVTRETYLDTQDQPVRIWTNYASITTSYDRNGNPVEICYEDENGQPCLSYEGAAFLEREYDETGNLLKESYYGMDGQAVCIDGYHSIVMEYDEDGNLIQETYQDEDGQMAENENGCAAVKMVCDEYGNTIEWTYYDKQGRPTENMDSHSHKVTRTYDTRGNLTETTKTAAYGYRIQDAPYEIIRYEYDSNNNLIREIYMDGEGNLDVDENGGAVYEYTYDAYNRPTLVRRLDAQGEPEDTGGYASYEIQYDEKHRQSRLIYYGAGGTGEEDILYQDEYVYDSRGNQILAQRCAGDGSLLEGNEGYARVERSYDAAGNETETAYYDTRGELCCSAEGFARVERKYDLMGNVTALSCYDEEGRLTETVYGYAELESEYDEQGRLVRETYYGADGQLSANEDGKASIIEYIYDQTGGQTGTIYYDREGRQMYTESMLIYMSEVGEKALDAGIRENDLLFRYGEWEILEYEDFEAMADGLLDAIDRGADEPKELVIGRYEGDGNLTFERIRFEAGAIGVRLADMSCSSEEFEACAAAYREWLENEEE